MAKSDPVELAIKRQVKIAKELGIAGEDLERIMNAKTENEAIAIKHGALMRRPDHTIKFKKR